MSSLLVLSNCGFLTPEPEIIVQTEYIERNIEVATRPSPVNLYNVRWYVVNEENIDEFIEEFRNEEGTVVFVATSINGYESLSLNLAELRRYIIQQQEIIVYYENSIQ